MTASAVEIGSIVLTPYNVNFSVSGGDSTAGFEEVSFEADVALAEAEQVEELSNNRTKTYLQGSKGVLTTVTFVASAFANYSGAYLLKDCNSSPDINPQRPFSRISLSLVRLGAL